MIISIYIWVSLTDSRRQASACLVIDLAHLRNLKLSWCILECLFCHLAMGVSIAAPVDTIDALVGEPLPTWAESLEWSQLPMTSICCCSSSVRHVNKSGGRSDPCVRGRNDEITMHGAYSSPPAWLLWGSSNFGTASWMFPTFIRASLARLRVMTQSLHCVLSSARK